ncbi:hypothetical protein CZ771_08405 [Actinomycetales bacterium JB111]|nr:hypothetical protein CZ771_08405 [Actinomycetales bacterium JB111]
MVGPVMGDDAAGEALVADPGRRRMVASREPRWVASISRPVSTGSTIHIDQPAGGSGHRGSGRHPTGGMKPAGTSQPGGGLNRGT